MPLLVPAHPIAFLLSFIPGLVTLALFIYFLLYIPRNRQTTLFGVYILGNLAWQVSGCALRGFADRHTADLWDSVMSIGWGPVGVILLYFSLLYTKRIEENGPRGFRFLVFIPTLIFVSVYQSHAFPHNLVAKPFWGYVLNFNSNWFDYLFSLWIAVPSLVAIINLLHYAYTLKGDPLGKKQAMLIAWGLAIPSLLGILFQGLLPAVLHQDAVPVTPTTLFISSLVILVALRKYKLFSALDYLTAEQLTNQMPILLFSTTAEGRITYMNEFGRETLNLTDTDLALVHVSGLFWSPNLPELPTLNHCLEAVKQGQHFDDLELGFNSTHQQHTFLFALRPILEEAPDAGALFIGRDISPLKSSELMIRRREAQLKEAQLVSRIGSWSFDPTSQRFECTDEMLRLHGLPADKYWIPFEQFRDTLHPDDRYAWSEEFLASSALGQAFSCDYRLLTDGEERSIHFQAKPGLSDGYPDGGFYHGTAQDMTELKHSEVRLMEQNTQLNKINQELDRFVYSVSHDLRSPLTSILGLLDLASWEASMEELNTYLGMIKECVLRLDRFILDILDYSRNARTEAQINRFDLKEFLEGVVMNFQFSRKENLDLSLTMTSDSDTLVSTDANRLGIIMNNLVSNAIKYSKQHAEICQVRIVARCLPQSFVIEVHDNGIGIEAKDLERIFDMFYRASRISDGSGIGLYIVKEAVDKIQGRIEVESAPEQGSTFRLILPNLMFDTSLAE